MSNPMIERCSFLPCRQTSKTVKLRFLAGRKFCERHYRLLSHVHCVACNICLIGHFGDMCIECSKEWVWVASGGYYERNNEQIDFNGERTTKGQS